MAADDFQNPLSDQGFPSELDPESPYAGNRPASGARRATPGEVLTQGFQGGAQNAGDFLGLDTEFTGHQDQGGAFGGLDLAPPPGTYGSEQMLEPAPLPDSDPVQDFAQAPSAFEFGEDLGSDEAEADPFQETPAPSRTPMLVAALAVAALTATGVMYGPKLYQRLTTGSEIPRIATQPQPRTTPTARTAEPAPVAVETPTEAPVDPVAGDPGTTVAGTPAPVEPEAEFDPAVSLLSSAQTPAPVPAPAEPTTVSPTEPEIGVVQGGATPSTFPDLGGAAFDWASPTDQLELIWRGSQIPLEALAAPAKTLMPRVGRVMVFTTGGDVFEGRLYAVGENRVWVDAEPGRIGIDGDQVERIEVLPPDQQTAGEVHIAGGRRVRAAVAGGMLYGRVLKTAGDEVILALDDGGRVTVKASDLEDLGTGRVSVVGR